MAIFRDEYFYTVQTSESSYRETPGESLSVSRLLQNKAYWKTPFDSSIKKKKKLIINDTSIANWNKTKCIIVADRLKYLQDEGFEIYVPSDDGLTLLDTTAFNTPQTIMPKPFLPDETLAQNAARQLKVSRDEIFILNQT